MLVYSGRILSISASPQLECQECFTMTSFLHGCCLKLKLEPYLWLSSVKAENNSVLCLCPSLSVSLSLSPISNSVSCAKSENTINVTYFSIYFENRKLGKNQRGKIIKQVISLKHSTTDSKLFSYSY